MDRRGRLSYGALFCCVELLLMDKRGQPRAAVLRRVVLLRGAVADGQARNSRGRLSYGAPLQFPHATGYGGTRGAT